MKKHATTFFALGIGALALANFSTSARADGSEYGFKGEGFVVQIGSKHRHRRLHGFPLGHNEYYGDNYFGGDFGGDHYYDEACRYYKQKARWTGRRYWWKKYRRCMRQYSY